MVLPRPHLPAARQAVSGRLGAHPGRAAGARLRQGHRRAIAATPGSHWSRRAANSRKTRTPTPRSRCIARRARSTAARRSRSTRPPSILNDKGQPDSAAYYFGQAAAVARERDRHDRHQVSAIGRRSTRARCCSTPRSTIRRPSSSSSTSSGCRTTSRPSAAWPPPTASTGKVEQAQALEKELVAAGGRGAGPVPAGVAGARRTS